MFYYTLICPVFKDLSEKFEPDLPASLTQGSRPCVCYTKFIKHLMKTCTYGAGEFSSAQPQGDDWLISLAKTK